MDPLTQYIMSLAGQIGAPIVGVFITFRLLMNGMRADITATKDAVGKLDAKMDDHTERLVRLETRDERRGEPRVRLHGD